MKKKILKGRKTTAHGKTAAQAKRCDCCGASACMCPASHRHAK